MKIMGLMKTSLVDWDGKTSMVLFLGGCNFRCPFCHNSELVHEDPSLEEIAIEEVLEMLSGEGEGWRDAVVITGGEPMMHPEVFGLCSRLKEAGVAVKMDSNGYFPYPLKRLIEQGLCDYVAMDIKAPLNEKYSVAAGRKVEPDVLRRSIRVLKETGISYEFRTTLVPGLVDPEDIPAIGKEVEGAPLLVLQPYEPDRAAAPGFRKLKSYTPEEARAMAQELGRFVKEVRLRGRYA